MTTRQELQAKTYAFVVNLFKNSANHWLSVKIRIKVVSEMFYSIVLF